MQRARGHYVSRKCSCEYDLEDPLCRFEMLRKILVDTTNEEHGAGGYNLKNVIKKRISNIFFEDLRH